MNLARAKQLFFDYDGSQFYMSRNSGEGAFKSVEDEYKSFKVPAGVEKQWLEELTDAKLQLLGDRENWKIVHFLLHHGDTRHLSRLRNDSPRGVFWQKCAYLEVLVDYVKLCLPSADGAMISEMCDSVLESALSLKKRVRSAESISRVDELITSATELRRERLLR